MRFPFQFLLCCAVVAGLRGVAVSGGSTATVKTEFFDADPKWEGFNNRVTAKRIPQVAQEFGFSASNFAGKEKGEIGGQIWRSSTRASYAGSIRPVTLGQKLSASGTFAVKATSGSSGVFFGWFNSTNTGNGRRDTLGFRFAGQGSGARLSLQLVTDKNQACGTKVTPWVVDKTKAKGQGRKYRPTSIKNDGTRYTWRMSYDPALNEGNGGIEFTIRSGSSQPDEFETKTHRIALPSGYKEHGTCFDRLGLMNGEKGGNPMTIYFDDLQYEGRTEDFAVDPGWTGKGNQISFEDRDQGGAHDFGFCAQTRQAGGAAAGELGGLMWRCGTYAYYADSVGLLTLTNRLEARGRVFLSAAPPDSGMYLGWFNSAEKENAPSQAGDFMGIKVGGPTRVGHYFVPAYATKPTAPRRAPAAREHLKRIGVEARTGPVLTPGKAFDWTLLYDPSGNEGTGILKVTLGTESAVLPLKKGDQQAGAAFDRFGIFTPHIGGSYVRIYLDDLVYSTGAAAAR